jgi:hypothetical protein
MVATVDSSLSRIILEVYGKIQRLDEGLTEVTDLAD